MLFSFETLGLLSVLFVSLRLGVLFFISPLDAFGRAPRRFVILLIFVFSAVLVSLLGARLTATEFSTSNLSAIKVIITGLSELGVGLAMALGIYVAYSAFVIAGQLIDAQVGFAAAAVLNPATNVQEPIMGVLLQLLALALFFAMGLHHLLIEAIVLSFELVPVGTFLGTSNFSELVAGYGVMFTYGLVLAAPVLTGMLLIDIGIAMTSRTMPQMNIYFVMLPLKMFVGLFLLAVSMKYIAPMFEEIYLNIYRAWDTLLG